MSLIRKKLSDPRSRYSLIAFGINFLIALYALVPYIIMDGGIFTVSGDFNCQQIPFAVHANDAIKSGNVMWDWALDLGSSFLGGYAFYILGNPSFYLALLFPASWFMYVIGWIYTLKYALAGLFAFWWIRRYVKNPWYAIIGSVLYAFSGYSAENLMFYHFHDVVYLFPLLLMAFEGSEGSNHQDVHG